MNSIRFCTTLVLVFILFNLKGIWAQEVGFLNVPNMNLKARFNHYDPDRYNLLLERKQIEIGNESGKIDFKSSNWQITRQTKSLEKGKYKVDITFKCLSGEIKDASLSVDFVFSEWSKENFVLLPAAAYNGNRYEAVQMDYSPFYISQSQMGLNKPILISDQPRLNFRDGYSRIQERSGAMSLPSIGFHSPGNQQGFWLCFKQANEFGDYGVDIEENKGRTKATISLTSPVVREKYRHSMTRMDEIPSTDQPAHFKQGDVCTFSFIISSFASADVQSLFNELKDIRTKHYPSPEAPDLIPFSKVVQIIEKHKNLDNWQTEGYYSTAPIYGPGSGWQWQPGWCGGLLTLYPLFAEGANETKNRVIQNLNWLYPQGISPSGYYFDNRKNDKFVSSKDSKPFGKDLLLTRKNADAVYFALKLFDLLKKQNIAVKEEWSKANLQALNAQLQTWMKHRQLGQYVNQQTGELVVGGTPGAAVFVAALCEAYRQYSNSDYLEVAKQMADYLNDQYLSKGLAYGGPSDAMQSFDSEAAYAMLESFTELYELTLDSKWLTIARNAANQFASWVVAYDYKFPPETDYGKLDMRSTGTVYANTQNKTSCGGICTHSGIALLKLYRATSDRFYLNLLRDIAHTIPQFMSRSDRQLPGYKDGWIFERCNMTDWEKGIGVATAGSTWAESAMLLTVTELPGVYVNKSTKEVFAIDHVEARLNKNGQLEITNPTQYDAVVKVLAETKEQMAKPLGQNAFLGWEKVEVKAGKTEVLFFD